MKGIVLAGGEGRRLKPLTQNRPKPLLPVAGRPCVDYVLRSLINSGVRELIVTTAFMSDALIKRDLALVFRKDKALSRAALAFIDIAVKLKAAHAQAISK